MLMLEKPLRFASAEASIDIPSEVQSALLERRNTPALLDWAESSVGRLNTLPCGVVFRIGKLRLPEDRSRALAHAIIYAICAALRRLDAPEGIEVEIDRPQPTRVMPGQQSRTLLPHHDGGHCSYLTPSQFDDPTWQPALRRFSSENFTTTQAHKLYQGIFIADPGEGLSITTYFNWVEVVRRAYTRVTGQGDAAVARVAAWLGANIRASLQLQPQHKSKYLSLTAALGARALVQHGLAVHYAEADFTPEELERFPELCRFREQAAQVGLSPTEFLLSQGLIETLGLSWVDFRATYQLCVPSERFDLLLGHNLTLVHGGLMGGPGRLIEPICLVMNQPNGEDYERWLAQAWRSQTAPA